jgi:hypothetical protein
MRLVVFGEPLPGGTRLTLVSDDKPDRFFTVIKFWVDETSGVALALKGGVPTYRVEDEEGRSSVIDDYSKTIGPKMALRWRRQFRVSRRLRLQLSSSRFHSESSIGGFWICSGIQTPPCKLSLSTQSDRARNLSWTRSSSLSSCKAMRGNSM